MDGAWTTVTVLESFRLDGQVALVTGAAGGIGGALAEAVAEAGADVALVDVDESGLAATADQLEDTTDARTLDIVADVGDPAATERMAAETRETLGGLDVAFANAGIAERGGEDVAAYDVDAWDRVMRVNLRGVFLTNRAVAGHMRDTGGGSIVNTASILGLNGTQIPGLAAYTASKGGVVQLTRQFAGELAPDIRVNAIAPGWIETPLLSGPDSDRELTADDFDLGVPLGRMGQPADLKGIAVFLASDAAAYTTGEIVLVDGGLNAA